MFLVSAEMQGFTSYYDHSSVEFKEGLTGIVGEYDDDIRKSMGAGKSSIFMSLLYSLFSKGAFKTNKEVINDEYSDKQHMFTKHRFVKNNTLYEVERGYQQGNSYLDFFQINFLNNEEKKIPLGENKIGSKELEILRVLNWDYDMFTASIFFEQDKLSKLVDTDGSKKREYIEKVLHIRNWTLLQDFPKKKLLTLEKEKLSVQEKLLDIGNSMLETTRKLSQYQNIDNDILLLQKQKEDLTKEKDTLTEALSDVKDQITTLENLSKEFISTTNSKQEYDAFILREESSVKLAKESVITLDQSINELSLKKEAQTLVQNSLLTTIQSINNNIKLKQQEEGQLKNQLLKYEIAVQQIEKHITDFEAGICDQCEQDITQEYADSKKDTYAREIISIKDNITKVKAELVAVQNQIKEEVTLKSLKDSEISLVTQELQQLTSRMQVEESNKQHAIKEVSQAEKRVADYNNNLVRVSSSLVAINEKLKKLNIGDISEIPKILEEKRALLENENLFNSLTTKIKDVEEELRNKSVHKGLKEGLENSMADFNKLKLNKEAELLEIGEKITVENFILKGFKQIPSIKFNEEIEKLQKYANIYIKKFIPQMSIFIKEDVSKSNKPIDVYYTLNDKERSYRMLSGGQKTVGNLGLRLAFSNIISEKTSSASDFLILDEPFAYLDAYSRDLVKEVLLELQKIYRQIFVISHIDNVFEFPNVIKTQMRGQRSYIIN